MFERTPSTVVLIDNTTRVNLNLWLLVAEFEPEKEERILAELLKTGEVWFRRGTPREYSVRIVKS